MMDGAYTTVASITTCGFHASTNTVSYEYVNPLMPSGATWVQL